MKNRLVTLRQVSSCDTVAFVARLLLIFTWIVLLLMVGFMATGAKKPEESPAEIAFIMACFSTAFLLVILARRAKVEKLIRDGTPAPATLNHYSHYLFFITVGVDFNWREEPKKRMVQLPAAGVTGVLKNREHVTLMIDPEDHRRLIIKELYAGEQGL
jgi:hypothetical protein